LFLLCCGWAPLVGQATTKSADDKSTLSISQAAIGKMLGDYTLKQPDGTAFELKTLRGKPVVISLIYTSCYHICPTTTRHLASVVRKARSALGDDSFVVLTIGFDVDRDKPEVMARFAAEQAVDMGGWYFLSMDSDTMTGLTRDLGFIFKPSAMGFDHLIQASIIDAQGRVYRQVYDMKFSTPMLIEPLKQLVYGKPGTSSVVDHLENRIRLFCTVYDPKTDRYIFDYSMFIGMIIGITTLLAFAWIIFREWRRHDHGK